MLPSHVVIPDLSFARNNFAHLHYSLTEFAVPFACCFLNFSFQMFSFAFSFQAGIVSHFSGLVLDRANNLFAFAFNLVFVPQDLSPLLVIASMAEGSVYMLIVTLRMIGWLGLTCCPVLDYFGKKFVGCNEGGPLGPLDVLKSLVQCQFLISGKSSKCWRV